MLDNGMESAIKRACKDYRNSCEIGKHLPLSLLRPIWRAAFIAGARYTVEAIGKSMNRTKGENDDKPS